uniref:NADH dehydrogenase [ubiquinone] 1 beta subcomplex subunit 6 n=1 Tax=Heterorhabditis bacteriophora TaxID=37862 RepID=A0A1I7WWD6_HETBA
MIKEIQMSGIPTTKSLSTSYRWKSFKNLHILIGFLLDQHLHPDEPIVVDAVHRQLNPIRVLYRYPWDKLNISLLAIAINDIDFLHVQPTFGVYYGTAIRVTVPKLIIAFAVLQTTYYYWKYEVKDWTHLRGIETMPQKEVIVNSLAIEAKYPGLQASGLSDPSKNNYFTICIYIHIYIYIYYFFFSKLISDV